MYVYMYVYKQSIKLRFRAWILGTGPVFWSISKVACCLTTQNSHQTVSSIDESILLLLINIIKQACLLERIVQALLINGNLHSGLMC